MEVSSGDSGAVLEPWGHAVTPDPRGCVQTVPLFLPQGKGLSCVPSATFLSTAVPCHPHPPRCTSGRVAQLDQAPSASVCLFTERGTPRLVS